MKKFKFLISAATCAAAVFVSVPFSVNAAEGDDLVYGTMNIPYADFYEAEFGDSANAYEVDAVSSATTEKWSGNGEGELFEGTYNEANEDGTGTILGVTYPVAITQADLDALGDNNYNFTELDSTPAAYKNVTVADGEASFSAVVDNEPETVADASVAFSAETVWGDYIIDIENGPEFGVIYGALIKTEDGSTYAMRHEENIWRGELAWSSGIVKTEAKGNALSYENFVNLMGSTINEIVFITDEGYVTIETDTYVPVKFEYEINIEDVEAGTGETTFITTGIPEDFDITYSLADNFTVTDGVISFTDAAAGSYTLTITDSTGKYNSASASFLLTTDEMPAAYADGAIVKADGAEDADFESFLKNIEKVTVNGTEYSATGHGAIQIVGEDGVINSEAASRQAVVFPESGSYEMVVTAMGYNTPLEFTFETEGASVETEEAGRQENTSEAAIENTEAAASESETENSSSMVVVIVVIIVLVVVIAAASVIISKKKNK